MFIDELRKAIRGNQPIAPLLNDCIRPPKAHQNPLVTSALALFGDERCKAMVIEAIKDNLFTSIKDNQEALTLLNSTEGRAYLHRNLDSLLSYLVSDKFQKKYACPKCHVGFFGKCRVCPGCGASLVWNKKT